MGSLPFLIIITTIVIIIHRPSSVHGNQQYIMCNTNFTCGDIPDVGYPFWGSGRPNYCGFPGFELNCSTGDNQSPEINIGNLTYKVDSIDNSSNLLTLSRTDYESDLCPTSLKNTTLVDTLFTLASDTEPLYLYYGCSQLNMTTLLPFQFTCDIIGPTSTSFYLSGNTSSLTSTTLSFYQLLVEGCASSVYIPVSPSRSVQMMANPNADNVVSAIREGFGLIWNANNGLCEACRVSGGLCGYDTENNRFNCHCPDQTYLTTCQGIRARTSESPSQGKAATASQQPLAMTISSPPLSFILLAIFISSSTMHPLILFFAFSALQTTSFATSSDAILTNCAYRNFSCGSLQNVSYPFTGGGLPDYCGPPDFLLKCVDGSVPELTIDSLSYLVLHLDQPGRAISLARSDLYDTGCTTQFKNTTLDKSSFDASSGNEILTLFYGCTPFMTFPLNISFSCGLGGEVREDVYFLIGTVPSGLDLSSVDCKERISLPILRSSVEKLVFNQSRVLEVLRDGFNVSYRNPYEAHCEKCRESHGRCGFDQESIKPICICGDRLCPGGNSKKISVGLGIGIGGVGVIFILLVFWLFLVIRRRKRKVPLSESKDISELPSGKSLPTTTTNFSQSIPSYPFLKSDLEKGSTYFGVQVFSYTELEKATDNFDSSKELGEGGFGVVYYGVLNDGRVVAVKRLYESSVKRVEQFMNEVEILAHLRHKNLVTLYGCTSKHSRDLLLVYEYIPNGTVADHLLGKQTNSGLLTWPVRLSIAIETAEALTYLHELEVIHRDVKTNNILLDNNFHVKVADFGLSRLFPTNVTHVSTAPQGTPGYVDPEYYQCFHLTDKSDVYSFGVVLIELISSLPAVDTNRHRHDINLANMAINKIQNHALHELVDPCLGFEKDSVVRRMITSVAELAFRCLQRERDMRPSMEEVRGILRGIENQSFGGQKAEVVDIGVDDVGLLNNSTPLSPDSIVADKWVSSSTTTNSF